MNDLHITVEHARKASEVLENEAFRAAMSDLREAIIGQWKACPIRDREGQMLLLQMAKMVDKFEGLLFGRIEAGKMASKKLHLDSIRNESAPRRFMRKVAG
jgi:hypothetical protein